MVRTDLEEHVILQVIGARDPDFDLTAGALVRLKKDGVGQKMLAVTAARQKA